MGEDAPTLDESARRLSRGIQGALLVFFALSLAIGLLGRGGALKRGAGEGRVTAFVGVRVFDGGRMKASVATVILRGASIERIGPAREVEVPPGAEVIDGEGRTLLPGFIDAHVHLGIVDARTALARGITSARDLGWPLGEVSAQAADAIRDPAAGPSLSFAGPILTAPGGYPSRSSWAPNGTALEVAGVAEAERAVASLAERSAAVIKVAQEPRQGPTLAPGVVRAIVRAAHAAGLKVASHVGSLEQLRVAIDAGVDELAHGLWSDEVVPDDVIARMVRTGITVIPTLHIDPSPERIDALRRFVAAGGRVIYGTDMGNPPAAVGIDVDELRLMVRAGMTPAQAIAAATSISAATLGLRSGRILNGRPADLVLVEGDPLRDLSVLAEPILVAHHGVLVS